jgi:hypothetical protein
MYGVHQVTPYSRTTGLPYGTLRVLGNATISLAGELVSLTGGSSSFPWAVENGAITPEITLNMKELQNFLINIFLGKEPTQVDDDAGSVDALANVNGTSAQDATTGIASVSVESGEEAELKFGKYIVKVVSATTIDVYALTNVDFRRGTDKTYENDLLKITPSPLTIAGTGGTTSLSGFGVEFTGGSGTVDMTTDDTAEFSIYPPSLEKVTARIGAVGDCVPEFGILIAAQKLSDGTMWTFDCFKVKALGFPFGMAEKAFNEAEVTMQLMNDSAKDGVLDMKRVQPATACG